MTTDYSKLDTAALVAAADALMEEITPGAWTWDAIDEDLYFALNNGDPKRVRVIEADQDVVCVAATDAAFIAAAPALVRALVTRLRESEKVPPLPKFKVNDRVQLKSWSGDTFLDWKAGTILTVYGMMYYDQERRWSYDVGDDISQRSTPEYDQERRWSYDVGDDISQRSTPEYNLERVENG